MASARRRSSDSAASLPSKLGAAETVAGLHVEKVIEKSLVAGDASGLRALRCFVEEAQGGQGSLARLLARDPAALHADRVSAEAEADGGHAGE
jgi:hypothetical protein